MSDRIEMIGERLRAAMPVDSLVIEDDSHLHAGHAGARAGGGHYRVRIVSSAFCDLGTLARHRLVYQALGDAIRPDTIHALNIQARTPDEAASV